MPWKKSTITCHAQFPPNWARLHARSVPSTARRDAYLADRKGLHERLQQDNLRQQHEQMQAHEKNTLEMMAAAEKDHHRPDGD